MVGRDGHLVIGAKHAEGINQQAAHRLFNSMNCLLLAEKKPTTLAMLEEAYLEMEGSSVPHHKFGFPSGLHLVAAWFDRAWFRGQVVIVPIFSDQVAHLFSADCRFRSIWSRLPKVDSWVPSLFLASASLVIERLKANLGGQVGKMMKMSRMMVWLFRCLIIDFGEMTMVGQDGRWRTMVMIVTLTMAKMIARLLAS